MWHSSAASSKLKLEKLLRFIHCRGVVDSTSLCLYLCLFRSLCRLLFVCLIRCLLTQLSLSWRANLACLGLFVSTSCLFVPRAHAVSISRREFSIFTLTCKLQVLFMLSENCFSLIYTTCWWLRWLRWLPGAGTCDTQLFGI